MPKLDPPIMVMVEVPDDENEGNTLSVRVTAREYCEPDADHARPYVEAWMPELSAPELDSRAEDAASAALDEALLERLEADVGAAADGICHDHECPLHGAN